MSFKNIIFDCDSTLCAIEGIDVLAKRKGKEAEVAKLTDAAMNGDVPLNDVYNKRLEMINPGMNEITDLSKDYIQSLVKDAAYVVDIMHKAGMQVFIVSGGLYEPIKILAEHLNIEDSHVHAVKLNFVMNTPDDEKNMPFESVVATPLTTSDGKRRIVGEIRAQYPGKTLLIGDGISDAVTKEDVDLFVGYGGICERAKVKEIADVYISSESLLPLLKICGNDKVNELIEKDNKKETLDDLFAESVTVKSTDNLPL